MRKVLWFIFLISELGMASSKEELAKLIGRTEDWRQEYVELALPKKNEKISAEILAQTEKALSIYINEESLRETRRAQAIWIKQPQAALTNLLKALAHEKDHFEILIMMAKLELYTKNCSGAESYIQQIDNLLPQSPAALAINLDLAHCQGKESEPLLPASLQILELNKVGWSHRARHYLETHNKSKLTQALKDWPKTDLEHLRWNWALSVVSEQRKFNLAQDYLDQCAALSNQKIALKTLNPELCQGVDQVKEDMAQSKKSLKDAPRENL